jgi:hypothetical protein
VRSTLCFAVVLTGALALGAGPAPAVDDAPPTECDRLAAAPDTVAGVAGMAFEEIDAAAAVPACGEALRDYPDVTRFVFQYGRALERAGDRAAAARLYEWAATDGLAPAQHALARMLQAGDGIPADPDAALRWLQAAADQGYAPAVETLAAPAPAPSPEPDDDSADPDPVVLADSLEGIAGVLDAYTLELPRSRFDPLAVLQPAGVGAEALTAWIGREVALVPYQGSLRGARGTLMDRYGNSLDRALLLAELLAAAGHEVRLARATLDPAAAAGLLDAFTPPPPDEPPAMAGDVLAARLAQAAGPQADAVEAELAEAASTDDERKRAIDQRSDVLTRELLAALGDLPERGEGDDRAAAIAALQDHWWVQVRDGDRWTDADPSAAVAATPVPQETLAPEDLPASLRHRVTMRLLVEFWEEGRLREETIFTHELVPSELIDRPVVLRHLPLGAPSPEELLEAPDLVAAALAAATDAWVWQPVLTVGDEAAVDQLFTTRGEVLPAGPESMQSLGLDTSMFSDFASDIGDVFGDGPAAQTITAPDEANAPIRVSAEWLEITVTVPGESPVTHRRTVFDLLGPTARASDPVPPPTVGPAERLQRALGLLREIDVMIAGAAPAPSFVRAVVARDGADLMRIEAELLRSAEGWSDVPLEGVRRIPLPLYHYALLRHADEARSQVYLNRPNVALAWSGIAGTGSRDVRETLLFDIVVNDLAPAATDDPFAARLAQGVRDTVVEAALAGPTATGGTAALYEADRSAGRDWVRLDPAQPEALEGLALPADSYAAIARDLAAGAVVIAPPAPVATDAGPQVAWWRIDPRTGTTLGMTPDGGATLVDHAMQLSRAVVTFGCYARMGMAMGRGQGGTAAGIAFAFCAAGGTSSIWAAAIGFRAGVAAGMGMGAIAVVAALIAAG